MSEGYRAFNSLFEIPKKYILEMLPSPSLLSILFLRFPSPPHLSIRPLSLSLSILFLRFVKVAVIKLPYRTVFLFQFSF